MTAFATRRLLRVWSILVSGTVLTQLLGLVALGIAASALEPVILGGIVLIQGVARTLHGVINVQSGVTLIKYGTDFLERDDRDGFLGLLKMGFLLDLVTALAAAAICAAVLVVFAGSLGVPESLTTIAPWYALSIAVAVPGVHTTVLRVFDRYGRMTLAEAAGALLRVVLVAGAWWAGLSPVWFLLAWLVGDVVSRLAPLVVALVELRRRGYSSMMSGRARRAAAAAPGFWRMIWTTNGSTSVRALSQEGDVVLAGWIVGAEAAALLRIGKSAAAPLLHLGGPIQQAAFPDLVALAARAEWRRFVRSGLTYCAAGAGVGAAGLAATAVLAPWVVALIAGPGYEAAAPVMIAVVAAHAVYLCGIAFLPMASALERMTGFFTASVASTVVFLILAVPLLDRFGALGAGLALVAHHVVWLGMTGATIRGALRERAA